MKKKVIIAVIAILLIVGGVFVGLYFGTDIFKKNKDEKQSSSQKVLNKVQTYLNNSEVLTSDLMDKFNEKMAKSSYTTNGTVSMKASNIEGAEMLNNIKLTFNGKVNQNKKDFEENVALSVNGIKVDANFVKNDDVIGIQSDFLTGNNYVAIRNSNLKALASKLGVEDVSSIPDKIEISSLESFAPSNLEDKMTTLMDKYLNIIEEESKKFDVEKSEAKKVITITEKDVLSLIDTILIEAQNDNELTDFMYNILTEASNVSKESMNITKSEFINKWNDGINEIIDEVKESSKETNLKNKIVMTLSYDSKDIIENAKIVIYSNDISVGTIELESTKNRIDFSMDFGELQAAVRIEKEETASNVAYTFKAAAVANNQKVNFNLKVNFDNIDSNKVNEKVSAIIAFSNGSNQSSINVNFTNEIKFDDNIETVGLTNDNAVILNDLSETEIQTLIKKIYKTISMISK